MSSNGIEQVEQVIQKQEKTHLKGLIFFLFGVIHLDSDLPIMECSISGQSYYPSTPRLAPGLGAMSPGLGVMSSGCTATVGKAPATVGLAPGLETTQGVRLRSD